MRDRWQVDSGPNVADVYLKGHYREVEPRIWVGKCDSNQGMHFTLDEAEQLAATLLELVKTGRRSGAA